MAINFPTSLDSLSNPASGDKLDNPSHSTQHGNANDVLEALETKLGIGASPAGSATAGYAFVHSSGGTTAWSQVGYQGITSGTATSGQVLTAGTATGTSIWSTPTAPSLIQIVPTSVAVGSGSGSVDANGAVTFSGASSVSLNAAFTSAYQNYQIFLDISSSTGDNVDLAFRYRLSGTDTSTNYQYQRYYFGTTTAATDPNTLGTDEMFIGGTDKDNFNGRGTFEIKVFGPQTATVTSNISIGYGSYGTTYYTYGCTGWQNSSTQFDGITFYPSSGTMTGTIRVYGYKN